MIELGQTGAGGGERVLLGENALGELSENIELKRKRAICSGGDARFELAKLERWRSA